MRLFYILTILLSNLLCSCGPIRFGKEIKTENIDSIELIQVDHPYLGERVNRIKLDNKLIPEFIEDFTKKSETIVKFYSCYVIKIHLKDKSFLSYRTNGECFETLHDNDSTAAIYYKLNTDFNLITKYWNIPENQFCSPKAPQRIENIPTNAFWIGGEDGGNWYLIEKIDSTKQTVHFKIFNDFNGELIVDREFKLKCNSTEDLNWNNLKSEINSFDGETIQLRILNNENRYCYFE